MQKAERRAINYVLLWDAEISLAKKKHCQKLVRIPIRVTGVPAFLSTARKAYVQKHSLVARALVPCVNSVKLMPPVQPQIHGTPVWLNIWPCQGHLQNVLTVQWNLDFLLATCVLCGHVKDKLVAEQASLPCYLFT